MNNNSNSYFNSGKPYYFTHPPPVYDAVSGTWSYNWKSADIQNVRNHKADSPSQSYRNPQSPTQSYKNIHSGSNSSPTGNYKNAQPAPQPSTSIPRTLPSDVPVMNPTMNPVGYDQRTQNYYGSNPPIMYTPRRYSSSSLTYSSNLQYGSPQTPYPSTPVQYHPAQSSQYVNSMTIPSHCYSKPYYGKRKSDNELDVSSKKSNKKKKKPLSQNIPQRKDWSVEEAKRALDVEKEYNKRNKSQSLIIKFPDLELNRDIVTRFHSAIDTVHFQQPSTPRFCFVTLQDSADPETVMKDLNKIPFGHGYLSAEFKKDREDEINIGPEDIDPLTLYVGNLAQEVTKESMVNTYPKQKRIDIGYAKKMKYTRYAFVSFKCVEDSIEAFRRTHSTQMYSKSLIVRFRRLHGTVGMPGEPKPQMPPHKNDSPDTLNTSNCQNEVENNGYNWGDRESSSPDSQTLAPWEMVDVSNWYSEESIDLNLVKEEPAEDSDDEKNADIHPQKRNVLPTFMPGSLEVAFSLHRPKVKSEKYEDSMSHFVGDDSSSSPPQPSRFNNSFFGKKSSSKSEHLVVDLEEKAVDSKDTDISTVIHPNKMKKEIERKPSTYNTLRLLSERARSNMLMKDIPKEVKKEPSPSPYEHAVDKEAEAPTTATESTLVKNEPEDETNDGDKDDSSDSSDDFNFRNILSNIQDRSKKLKKLKRSVS